VDFWRKPPPQIGFGVGRHTLAYRKYHPGISPCHISDLQTQFSQCALQPVRAQGFERQFCVAGRDQSRSRHILPTQLRGSQGASFEPSVIRFRRRNPPVRIIQPGSAQHLGRYIGGSRELTGSDPGKPFRPITEEARALILRQVSSDSDGGIIRAHCQSPGGAQTPRGSHPGSIQSFSEPIFSLSDIRRILEARAHSLGQFSGRSDECSHQGEYIIHLQQLS
jgi:hypothetical protein